MIFLVDISRLIETMHFETPTGIDRVEMAYVRHFLEREGDVRFIATWPHFTGVLSRADAAPLIDGLARRWSEKRNSALESFDGLRAALQAPLPTHQDKRVTRFGASDKKRNAAAWANIARIWLRTGANRLSSRHLAEFRERGARYIHVSHFQLDIAKRFDWLAQAKVRSLFMLHDLIPLSYPEYFRPGEQLRHRARLDTMLRHACAIVANSQFTRMTLEREIASRNAPSPPCEVIPLGTLPLTTDVGAYQPVDAQSPYFVIVGTIEPRKNIQFLLSVWHRWTQGGRDPRARLVIVGRRGWENENVVDLLERSTGLAPSVIEVTSLSDAGLVSLLRGAAALVAPSFCEGYNLPVAEALALGVPVLASDIPVHREVGGSYAEYIHPLDGRGWAQAFDDYSAPRSPRRDAQRERLTAYRPMSWQRHMEKVEALLAR